VETAVSVPPDGTEAAEQSPRDVTPPDEIARRRRDANHLRDRTAQQPRTSERPIRVPRWKRWIGSRRPSFNFTNCRISYSRGVVAAATLPFGVARTESRIALYASKW